ncbi:MAG: hypothetical protein Roseis2KO_13610 [Roseivirga sp.]
MPNAFLRVGVQLPTIRSQNDRSYKPDLSYERVLSPRLTASVTLTSGFSFGRSFTPDLTRRSGSSFTYHDVLLGLDIDIKYYLSKGKYSGHYLSLVAKDVAAYTRYSFNPYIDITNSPTHGRNIESLPRIGIYYGYRKQFDSGWFLDGRIGYVPRTQSSKVEPLDGSNFDVKLGFGYTIPFRKKKK